MSKFQNEKNFKNYRNKQNSSKLIPKLNEKEKKKLFEDVNKITQLEKQYIQDFYLKYLSNTDRIFISSNIECIKPDKINLKLKDINIEQLIGKDNKNKFIKITKLINKTRNSKKDLYSKFDQIIKNKMNGEDRFVKYGQINYIDNFILKQLFYKKYNINKKLNSRAFRKLYEILITYPKLFKPDTKNLQNSNIIKTFDICGFPGGFTYALLYYTKTQSRYEGIDWYLQSLKPKFNQANTSTERTRSFTPKIINNKRVILGCPSTNFGGSGDITDIRNIKYYKNFFKDGKRDLIVSDCGQEIELDENQEKILYKVNFGQILTTLYCLAEGGNFIMKTFQMNTQFSLSIMALLSMVFKDIKLIKTESSKYTSSEYYICCFHYYNNLSNDNFKELDNIIINFNENTYFKKIFIDENSFHTLNPNFYSQLVDNYIKLYESINLKTNKYIELLNKYNLNFPLILYIIENLNKKLIKEYEQKYKYKKVNSDNVQTN
jgi:23S rRNA U2552 (ribose-2'-O)-methylase RlmE/FtsJ